MHYQKEFHTPVRPIIATNLYRGYMLNLDKFVDIIFEQKGFSPLIEVCQEGVELVEEQIRTIIDKNLVSQEYGIPSKDFSLFGMDQQLGLTKRVKLLHPNKNISIVAEITSPEDTPGYDVKMKVILFESEHNFSIEHEILVLSATNVGWDEILDSVKNMLSCIPELMGQLIYKF